MNEIPLTLDKPRLLKLTLKGLIEFEKASGLNFTELNNVADLSLEHTGMLLWSCLIWEDHDLKLDEVLWMADPGKIVEITKAILACIQTSFPEVKTESAPLAPTPKPETTTPDPQISTG